jgi:signal transduction histidine kinase
MVNNLKERGDPAERVPTRVVGELRRHVFGWMLLVALVPLAVMAAEGYLYGKQAIVQKTEEHLTSVLMSRRALVDQWVQQRFAEVNILAASPSIARCCRHFRALSEAEIESETTVLLDAVCRGISAYEHLGVYDASWNLIAASGSTPVSSMGPAPDELKTKIAAGDGTFVGMPTLDENGEVLLHVGRTIGMSGGKVGALYAAINITKGLTPLLQDRSGLGETGKTYLASEDLYFLTEPLNDGHSLALKKRVPELASIPRDAALVVRRYEDYLGNGVVYVFSQLEQPNWVLVAEMDVSEANEWLNVLARRAAITAVVTILALLVVATWISNRLGRPLAELAQVAQRIRAGHVEERLGPMRAAEAEEVRNAFNQMLDELRVKQQELVRTATLAYVGELTTSIVHEMRNPLSSVKMNLQALKRKVGDDPKYVELAEIATSQAQRLETMLDDLLQYGRPLQLKPESITFSGITHRVLPLVEEHTRSKSIIVKVEDNTDNSMVHADPEYMCRALTNLLTNAVQASSEGASIVVRGDVLNGASKRFSIAVLDSGTGLSSEVQHHLFKPFYTTKPGGTGLGLANVRKIVEMHGGSVRAENRPAGGTEFTVTLPMGPRVQT